MAVPQRRTSKTRKRMRRTHFKLNAKGLVVCKHCGEMIRSHVVCPHCGYYDGKPVNAKKEAKPVVTENKKTSKKKDKKAKEESK